MIHRLSVEDAFASLQSGPEGLSEAEASRRRREFGPNEVEHIQRRPLLLRFLAEFTHFFALILWFAAGLAFFAEWKDPGQGLFTLAIAIVGVILVNGVFSFWQEYRAEQALTALQKLLPNHVKALREGKVAPIPATELVVGDLISLEEGDKIPADCRLVKAFGVRVNNATITGEAMPQARDVAPSAEETLTQSENVLLAGTALVSGQAWALVFATGGRTEFGKIANLTQTIDGSLSPLQKEIALLSRLVAVLAMVLGALFFLLGRSLGLSLWANLVFAIGIIVANVPEGLLPTVTLALALASQRMAHRNALIRYLPAVETLGAATVICTDKTGTLTMNRMTVRRLFLADAFYAPGELAQRPELRTEYRLLLEGAWLCHNLQATHGKGRDAFLGDPMEIALREMAQQAAPDLVAFPRLDEIPFDSERRRLSSLHQTPQGAILYTKGALESLLPLCDCVQSGSQCLPLTPDRKAQLLQAEAEMGEAGLRVLAFAHRTVMAGYDRLHLEEGLALSGLVGLEDPPRPEVPDAIRKCREAGIRVIMITGDHPRTATAIAREIGLARSVPPVEVTGARLLQMSDAELQLILDSPDILFARVGAEQKLRVVSALQRKGEIVAVTGDGVNDAPALKQADIGIAMGISGTDVAREAADMVLMDDNFASIVSAIEEGRTVFANIRKFLTYILTSNVPELVPYLAFVLFKVPLALTIIQILAVDLGTDMLPALALGAERPEPGIMHRPPRSMREHLWDVPLLLRAYLWLGGLEAVAAMAAFFFVLHNAGWHYGQSFAAHDPHYLQATTACLSAIIVVQIANVFLCRSERASLFSFDLFRNRFLLWGIAAEIAVILLIDYTPWGHLLFATTAIPATVWLFVLPFALAMLVLEELRKWWLRARKPSGERKGSASFAGF